VYFDIRILTAGQILELKMGVQWDSISAIYRLYVNL